MRHIYALILTIVVVTMSLSAQRYTTVEVTTTEYGQLEDLLKDNYLTINSLIISGPVDEDDFTIIQHASYYGQLTGINMAKAHVKNNRLPDYAFSPYNFVTEGLVDIERLKLKWITLPETLEEIGIKSFRGSLVYKLDLPATVRKIGYDAFERLLNLREIDIPEGVEEIPNGCFNGSELHYVNLPTTIKTIDDGAFAACQPIINVDMKPGIKKIGNSVFVECKGLKSLIFPNTIEEFGTWNFAWGCGFLEELYLPDCITVIDDSFLAYYGFEVSLIKFRLPQYLESIDTPEFPLSGFRFLETLEFPETLSKIKDAFYAMPALRIAYTERKEPATCSVTPSDRPNAWTEVFQGLPEDATLYVPVGSGEAYRNAPGWKNFPNIIESDEPPVAGIKTATEASNATIRVVNGGVEITNGTGAQYTVCGSDGRVYASGICGETQNIALSKGIYVVRVGTKTLKVNI